MGKTVILDNELHDKMKNYCKKNKLKLNEYLNSLVKDHLNFKLENKSLLPMVLKNTRGEIIETIICTSISSEYKKNLPKELTLMRSSSIDGNGYIENYIQK